VISQEGKRFVQSLLRDITKRQQIEEELRNNHDFLEGLTNSIPDAVLSVKMPERTIDWINDSFEVIGYKPEECIGKTTAFLYPDENGYVLFGNKLKTAVAEGKDVLDTEQLLKRKNGEVFPAEITTTFFRKNGDVFRVTSIVRDIIERKRADEELRSSREQLRGFSRHLQAAREQERAAMAREIHDELGQTLTALKMDVAWLRGRLPEGQEPLLNKTKSMSDLIDATAKTVRRMSSELRPGLLDDLGIVAAVEWQTEEFQDRTGIGCQVGFDPEDIALNQDRSTTIFRILQETLTNVARHSKATRVKVSLKQKGSNLVLRVRDNGKGIAPDKISAAKSFGLMGIRERADLWGGEVKIRGAPDKGTTVTVSIPLEERKADDQDTRR